MTKSELCQTLKNLARQESKLADKGSYIDVSNRRLQVQLTQQAKISPTLFLFGGIFAFAGFVSGLRAGGKTAGPALVISVSAWYDKRKPSDKSEFGEKRPPQSRLTPCQLSQRESQENERLVFASPFGRGTPKGRRGFYPLAKFQFPSCIKITAAYAKGHVSLAIHDLFAFWRTHDAAGIFPFF